MESVRQPIIYKDLNLLMERAGKNEVVSQNRVLTNAIFHVLGTMRRQRLMRPAFGSFLYSLLFEPVNVDTAMSIQQEIYSALNDPANEMKDKIKVGLKDVQVKIEGKDSYRVTINYLDLMVNQLQVTTNFVLFKNNSLGV